MVVGVVGVIKVIYFSTKYNLSFAFDLCGWWFCVFFNVFLALSYLHILDGGCVVVAFFDSQDTFGLILSKVVRVMVRWFSFKVCDTFVAFWRRLDDSCCLIVFQVFVRFDGFIFSGHAVMPDVDKTFFTFDHVLLAALLLARSFAKEVVFFHR